MPEVYELDIDGFDVRITIKRVKNMYMRVKPPEGRVEITAPYYVHQRDIEKFVREKAEWIDQVRDRIAATEGIISGGPQGNSCGNVLRGWTAEREKEARQILEYKLPDLLKKWENTMNRKPSHLTLRIMKTRWGSCTPKTGRIRLNLALAFVPDELLEYVLVHELTHLDERGHGTGFQRRMTHYLPDWKQRRRALNSYGSY